MRPKGQAGWVIRIKDRRNNIMHPEMVLNLDEAFILFEQAKGAIMVMLPRLGITLPDAKPEEVVIAAEA